MAEITLNASVRNTVSKGDVKKLRRSGKIPGVFYYKKMEPQVIEVNEASLKPLVYTSEAHIVSLQIEGQEDKSCILKDIQFDPVTDRIVHFDLQGITKDEKLTMEVPVLFIGSAVGIKKGGILQTSLHKLSIECLPADVPQHIQIDISNLELGSSIHVEDIKSDKFTVLNTEGTVIVSVVAPKVEKEVSPEEAAEASKEPEVITKGKAEKED